VCAELRQYAGFKENARPVCFSKRIVLVSQTNVDELKKWAASAGVSYASAEALCKDPEAVKMVTLDLNKIGKGALGGNEALATVALLPGTGAPDTAGPAAPWTPENGFLTASNKLNRKPIEQGFKGELAAAKAVGIR
jgi:long-chain acyl-CoA synthetase